MAKQQTVSDLFKGSRRILNLAVPAFLTQASFTVTNVIDLIMIGTIGAAAIGGVGIAGITYWNLFIFLGSQTMAVTFLCSQSHGAGKSGEFLRRGLTAIIISLGIGIPVAFFSKAITGGIYTIMGAESAVAKAGAAYFSYRLIAFPVDLLNGTFEGMIKARGNTRTPMIIRLISHGINLLFNYLLIFGSFGFPKLGAAGAGIATMLGHCAAFILFLPFAFRLFKGVSPKDYLPKKRDVVLILRESGKIIVNDSSFSLSFLVYTRFVTGLGAISLAANEIAIHVSSMGFMPAVGFGQAAQILIGQHIGAKENRAARRAGLQVLAFCSIFMIFISLIFLIFPRQIASLFTNEIQVIEYLVPMLWISAAFSLLDGGQIVMSSALRGTGDTSFLTISTALISWALFVPMTFILLRVLHLDVIWAWAGTYVYMSVLFLAFILRYLLINWTSIRPK